LESSRFGEGASCHVDRTADLNRRIMGLDVGDRWVGVAISDPRHVLASPVTVIDRQVQPDDIDALLYVVEEQDIARIIVGLPRSMDGALRHQADKVQEFVKRLQSATDVPIEFRDERLSSAAAGRLLREAGRRLRDRFRDDAVAAAVILQGYLDETNP
jgi:putative holliday junction resolvase